MAAMLLQQLPPKHIRRLQLHIEDPSGAGDGAGLPTSSFCYAQTCKALAGGCSTDPYMPGITALQQLTCLFLSGCSKALLPQLPAQLQHLVLYEAHGTAEEPLQLGHLTALSRLALDSVTLPPCRDVLPPNVKNLSLGTATSTQQLAGLINLRSLFVDCLRIPPGLFLSGITQLGELTDILIESVSFHLEIVDAEAATASALRQMGAVSWPLASSLRELRMEGLTPAAVVSSTAVIRQLTGLQLLSAQGILHESDWLPAVTNEAVLVAAVQGLANAAAALPQLQSLTFSDMLHLDLVAARDLAALTGLTALTWKRMGLTDFVLGTICSGMVQLQYLCVDENPDVTDGPWPGVFGCAPRLWWVSCYQCGLTSTGYDFIDDCCRQRPARHQV